MAKTLKSILKERLFYHNMEYFNQTVFPSPN